jgi:hypothetical protein
MMKGSQLISENSLIPHLNYSSFSFLCVCERENASNYNNDFCTF